MKAPQILVVMALGLLLTSCEKHPISLIDKPLSEHLEGKLVYDIGIYGDTKFFLASRFCSECNIPATASFIPTVEQLVMVWDSVYDYDEPIHFQMPIPDANGDLYVADLHTVNKFNGIKDYSLLFDAGEFYIDDILFDEDNNVWLTGYDGLAYWDKEELHFYTSENSELPTDLTHGMVRDHEGKIWVTLDFEGLLVIDGDNWTHIPPEDIPGCATNAYLYNPLIDSDNVLWFHVHNSSLGNELLRYDGQSWSYTEGENGYVSIDSRGCLWLIDNSSDSTGLYYMDDGSWIDFDISGIDSYLTCVNADQEMIYIGTVNGLVEKER